MTPDNERLEIITCSYRPDLQRCRRLCNSIDRYVPRDIRHTVIVPPRDYAHFAPLQDARRTVLTTSDVLPARFNQLPGSDKLWVDRMGWPVRGWVMQQLVKLSASRATFAEFLLFADSDLQFLRDFDTRDFCRDGKLRLHRIPDAKKEGRHRNWHRRAGALLGEQRDYFGSDYVGQLITWRRSNLVALQRHIEKTQRRPWHVAVSRSLDISEYVLYGSFVEHVLGEERHGHFYSSYDLCHCCWFDSEARELLEGRRTVDPGAVALLVQSNLGLAPAQEHAVLQAALGRHDVLQTGVAS
jgi:hypothetical protein